MQSPFRLLSMPTEKPCTTHLVRARLPTKNSRNQLIKLGMVLTSTVSVPHAIGTSISPPNASLPHARSTCSGAVCERTIRAHKEGVSRGRCFFGVVRYSFVNIPCGSCLSLYIPGPHPTAVFEVGTINPHQTGAFFSWLVIHRGPCEYVSSIYLQSLTNPFQSVLIHPNIGDLYRAHTELATWMGRKWPLDEDRLKDRTLKYIYS